MPPAAGGVVILVLLVSAGNHCMRKEVSSAGVEYLDKMGLLQNAGCVWVSMGAWVINNVNLFITRARVWRRGFVFYFDLTVVIHEVHWL